MAAPNIVNVATITGKTALQVCSASATSIVSNGAGSGKVIKINALYLANINTSANQGITIDVYRGSTAYRLGAIIIVPVAATLDVVTKPIYLEEGDSLRLTGANASQIEAICSYEEIS